MSSARLLISSPASPLILIGGLAVRQHIRARHSEDIDLVCSHEVSEAIVRDLYPTTDWNTHDENDSEYRPDFVIKHKIDKSFPQIRFGPKILERGAYKFLDWNRFSDDATAYHVENETLDRIRVPCIEVLCFSKLISLLGRKPEMEKKIYQDLVDLVDLSNADGFRLGVFYNLIREAKAESHIRSELRGRLEGRTQTFSPDNSHLRWIADLFSIEWHTQTVPPPIPSLEPRPTVAAPRSSRPEELRTESSSVGRETQSLLRISALRGVNDYVERFHVYASMCRSRQDLEAACRNYHESILCAFRVRGGNEEQLEADVLELNDVTGELFMRHAPTSLDRRRWLPVMALRLNDEGQPYEPQPGDGVAIYSIWANMNRRSGVAIVNDTWNSGDVEYFAEDHQVHREAIGWYQSQRVTNMFKRSAGLDKPPYRSLLSATILQTQTASLKPDDSAELKCFGVLNLTSNTPHAFTEEDCAWAQACASLLGSFYQSYATARRLLRTRKDPVMRHGPASPRPLTGGPIENSKKTFRKVRTAR